MAFDFPNSPALNATWPNPPVVGQPVYTWDGEKWLIVNAPSAGAVPATALPLMDSIATVGVSVKYAREDHVHPIAEVHGQCKLGILNATTLILRPFNGNNLKINGVVCQIPANGITWSGSTSIVTYYVYAYMAGPTMLLELNSSTGHTASTTPGNVGVEIKAGDDSRTLVGLVYPQGATGQWTDTALLRLVRSWFNDGGVSGGSSSGGVISTTSGVTDTGLTCYLLSWAGEHFNAECGAQAWNNTQGQIVYVYVGLNGAAYSTNGIHQSAVVNIQSWAAVGASGVFTEGLNYLSQLYAVSGGTGSLAAREIHYMTVRR